MTLDTISYVLLVGQPEPISLGDAAIKVAIVTLFIAAVGFGLALWIRFKVGPMTPSGRLNSIFKTRHEVDQDDEILVVSSQRIAQGQTLLTVNWKGKSYLLGSSANSITCLAVNVEHDEVDMNS